MRNKKRVPLRRAWQMERRAWGMYRKRCPELFVSVVCSALFTALTPYVTIWFSARVIDELTGARDAQALVRWVLATLGVTAVLGLAGALLQRWKSTLQTVGRRLHGRLVMEKMLSADFADIDSQRMSDLYSQIERNATYMNFGTGRTLWQFEALVTAVLSIAGGAGMTASLFTAPVPQSAGRLRFLGSPLFAMAGAAAMCAAALASARCSDECEKYFGLYAPMMAFANRLGGFYAFCLPYERDRALDVRMYGQQKNVAEPYMRRETSFDPDSWIARKARGPMGAWGVLSAVIRVLLTGAVYLFVCLKAYAGAFGVGAVTQYIGAATALFAGVSKLLYELSLMRNNCEFMGTEFEFFDIPNAMYKGSLTTEKRADREYEVEFRDVSFRYPGRDDWALRHVNMKFRIGRRLAVVGRNGSGKTTFIKLLCRLYDPTEGEILLNGIDIRKYRYDDYMDIFSVVFQDFRLFAMPLGQNVAGRKEYDGAAVRAALEQAGFGARLAELPGGLSTVLYKDTDREGVELSGGEAQKIAIARALYKNAPFIILDEPTAALDPIAEAEIYEKFDAIAGDRTAVYISHRLSSCKFCDEIAVFDAGEVVQQGTHEALLAHEDGVYAALWHAQAQYYR